MRGAELKALRAAQRRYGPRHQLLQDMRRTMRWIEAVLAMTDPSAREFGRCAVDANLILNAEVLEDLGYRRFAARVRASISDFYERPTRTHPPGGGGSGGSGGGGQGAGFRIRYAPMVEAVGTPRTWRTHL